MPAPVSETPAHDGPLPPARLVGFLAQAAPKAVLLRRGPTDWFQLIAWDTVTDRFEDGQWFHGMVYDYAADLSPDGTLFLYGAAKYYTPPDPTYTEKWTAISHPPYYTALALWPQGQVPNAAVGGLFRDSTTIALNTSVPPHPSHNPRGLHVIPNDERVEGLLGSREQRLLRDGWTFRQRSEWQPRQGFVTPRVWQRRNTTANATLLMSTVGHWEPYTFALLHDTDPDPRPIEGAAWADWDHQNRLVFTRAGKLFAGRITEGALQETELADFNARQPNPMAPPSWAIRW